MKFYTDRYGDLFTKKQFEKDYFNYDSIKQILIDGYFTDEFITICFDYSKQRTIEEMLNYLIEEIKEEKDMFLDYLNYWELEEKEIDDNKIIEVLKEG